MTNHWRTSTHSGGRGTSCVQVAALWRTSTHSGSQGTDCVQVAVVGRGD